jgi:hypothetical protein
MCFPHQKGVKDAIEEGTLPLEPHPSHFHFSFSLVESCVFAHAGLDHDHPIYDFCVATMTGAHHHTQLIGSLW